MIVKQIGAATGIALGVILSLGFGALSSMFSTDTEVLEIAWSGILVRTILLSILLDNMLGPIFFFNEYETTSAEILEEKKRAGH